MTKTYHVDPNSINKQLSTGNPTAAMMIGPSINNPRLNNENQLFQQERQGKSCPDHEPEQPRVILYNGIHSINIIINQNIFPPRHIKLHGYPLLKIVLH